MRRCGRSWWWWFGALCCLLAGCARPGPDWRTVSGGRGGTLRLASQNDIRTLDTAIGYDINSWRFERLLNEGLLGYGADATLVPVIATALPQIRDGRVFTFRLRDDVRFHHGRLVEAADVKYAIERLLDPRTKSPAVGFYSGLVGAQEFIDGQATAVRGLRCPDRLSLEIELLEPDVAFLNVLAMPFSYPVPRELVERYTDPETGDSNWSEHVVGCGPYRLAEWQRGLRIRVEQFADYRGPQRGYLQAVEMTFGIPEFMQLMMFERGELDTSDVPLPDLDRVRRSPQLRDRLLTEPDNAIYYCSMNTELPPFRDVRVRQAFNYAYDKERTLRILNGTAEAATGVLPPGMPGYDPSLRGYPHDPAKARALLAAAGYGDGLSVELTTRSRPREKSWAQAIQQDLAEVGVKATLREVAFPQWLDLAGKRGQVAFSLNAWFQDYPDPSNFLDVLLNGEKITAENSNNRAFYRNPAVDQLLNAARGLADPERRLALYRAAERRIVADAPWIFCYYPARLVLVQPWVHGYRLHPVWSSCDERVWLAPPGQEEPPK
ncbi:MAG: ABC transporter substrate-binding protein [Fimbriimonadaceae bacterium]|nr:ABC transporter substrate-binding protein [Fimbriimonadaceae bacterium]